MHFYPKRNETRADFIERLKDAPELISKTPTSEARVSQLIGIYNTHTAPKADIEPKYQMDLFGRVGDEISAAGVSIFLSEAAGAPVRFNLFSGGGSMFEGAAIYAMISRYEGPVVMDILGLAASAMSFIAMAGDVVRMDASGQFMIHNAIGSVRGNSNEMRETADAIEKQQRGMIRAYAAKSGKSETEIKKLMDAETWFTASEALAAGFIDAIFEMEKDEAVAAEISADIVEKYGLQNIPKAVKVIPRNTPEKPESKSKPKITGNKMDQLQAIATALIAFNSDFNDGKAEGVDAEAIQAEIGNLTAQVTQLKGDLKAETAAKIKAQQDLAAANLKAEKLEGEIVEAQIETETGKIIAEAGVEVSDDVKAKLTRRVKRVIETSAEDEAELRADLREDAIAFAKTNGVITGEDPNMPKGPKKNQQKPANIEATMQPQVGTEDVVAYEKQLQAKVEALMNGTQKLSFDAALIQAKQELAAETGE